MTACPQFARSELHAAQDARMIARMAPVRADDGIILRTPLLPMTLLAEWAASPDPRKFLAAIAELPEVREALYVASPSLSNALDSWRTAPTSAASCPGRSTG